MKTLKEILPYYLNTGLKLNTPENELYLIDVKNNKIKCAFRGNLINIYEWDEIKPLLRPLSSLTKPITVEMETFIPIEKLKINPDWFYLDEWIGNIENMNFGELQLLLKWHFNVFNLPQDQFIEIKN